MSNANMQDSEPAATRRRGKELENALLDAAWTVLTEQGYNGFSYEAVAAKAGTSRPVLYRRWPQRDDLLLAAIIKHWKSHPLSIPDTGNLRDDAIGFLHNAERGRIRMMTLLSVQIMEFFDKSGSSFGALRDMVRIPGQLSPFETIVERAIKRGEIDAAPRSPRVVNLPFDLYRHEAFITMRPVPDETIIEIIDKIWQPLLKIPCSE